MQDECVYEEYCIVEVLGPFGLQLLVRMAEPPAKPSHGTPARTHGWNPRMMIIMMMIVHKGYIYNGEGIQGIWSFLLFIDTTFQKVSRNSKTTKSLEIMYDYHVPQNRGKRRH